MTNQRDLLRLLNSPPADCRPAMLWLLNGALTADRIREQIRQMADRGCGGFFLHPMADNFRPHDFISGMEPQYLSEAYFEMIRVAVEEADRLGLYAWLYDEGGWPSGTAQGLVLEGHPQLAAQVLRVGGSGEQIAELDAEGGVLELRVEDAAPAVDLLNPAMTARFIEVTHERYREAVGDYFGGTVPGIFTDEMSVRGEVGSDRIPWTDGMLEQFQARRGFDLRPWLPALFSAEAVGSEVADNFSEAEIAAVRCEFSELWTDLFQEAYFEPINRWCEQHGLIHTGHVGGEDTLCDHRRGFGHFFKTAGALHAPGVDAIWRQVFPGQENFCFPRFASSALVGSAPEGVGDSRWRQLTLSESFAVYGYSLTPEQMRWVADYQFLRGINYMAPMALYYDTSGGHWIATMSLLGEGNPLWDGFSSFADHCATMSAAVRGSSEIADVAVYYPIEAAWVGGEALERAWSSLQQVCEALERRQIAFDFIDARTLASADLSEGLLATAGQLYGAIIVPETPVMPLGAMRALAELHQSGGRVAFCAGLPVHCADHGEAESFEHLRQSMLADAVEMDRRERETMGGDDPRGLGQSMTFALDGFTAAYLGPGGVAEFTDREIAPDALLVVPEDEVGRLAQMLLTVIGRHELQLDDPEPELTMSSRVAGGVGVHLMHNEGADDLTLRLLLVNDEPRAVEQWDTLNATSRVVAVHSEVNEPTYFTVEMIAGESLLLITRPAEEDDEVAHEPELIPRGSEVRAQGLEIVSEAVITEEGDLQLRSRPYTPEETPADFDLRPLEEMGMEQFAGTVRYQIDLYVAHKDAERRLFLDLGEVGCIARARLNGEDLGESAWPPHLVEITGLVEPGINELIVEVTTNLANQAARDDVVEMARERGWMNAYYERVLPWMREGNRSGLIGPVRVLRERR